MAIYHLQRFCANLALSLTLLVSYYAAAVEFDDWIISESCSRDANKLCQGYYLQPVFPTVDPNKQYPVKITSDEASLVSKGTSVFKGNVKATQGDVIIYADEAYVEHDKDSGNLERITLQGAVKIMNPGLRIDGAQGIAFVGADRKKIDRAVYRLYDRHARGTAKNVEVVGSNCMSMQNATYTTCAPCSNTWYLEANKTKFNKVSGRGEAWHSFMYIKDVPVFYWPYVNFPIDKRRQTGFLQPEFENSSQNGATLIVPYYWNIAPNYDLLIRPQYMAKRSWKFDLKFRYLSKSSSGEVLFNFLPHDRAYRALRNEKALDPNFMLSQDSDIALRRNDLKPRDFRYGLTVRDNSRFGRCLSTKINYTTASDGNYFYDFTKDPEVQIYALQKGMLEYANSAGNLTLNVQQYQTFHVVDGPSAQEQLSKLPELNFSSVIFVLPGSLRTEGTANFTNFRQRNIADNDKLLSYGERIHARPALYFDITEPGYYFRPRVQLNYVHYSNLRVTAADQAKGIKQQAQSRYIPMYDVDSGLVFERTWRNSIMQTLEPRLYYLYVPTVSQNDLPVFDSGLMTFDYSQIFRDNRYSGLDRVSESNQIAMGLASKFYTDNGDEIGMLGIGQIYYFRNVILQLDNELDYTYKKWSPLAAIGRINISSEYNFTLNFVRFRNYADTVSLQLQYRPEVLKVVNFGFTQVHSPYLDELTGRYRESSKQFFVSTAWQTSTSVRLLGKYYYDVRFSRTMEAMAGLEYHTCCTALRFLWSRNWDAKQGLNNVYRNRFYLQFIFKGFAGVGTASDQFLEDMIPGFVGSSY